MRNRLLATTLILGAVSGFGLVGCSDTAKTETQTTTSTPTGTTTETHTDKVTTSGSGAPAPGASPTTEPAKAP